jgi:hypothetical protein
MAGQGQAKHAQEWLLVAIRDKWHLNEACHVRRHVLGRPCRGQQLAQRVRRHREGEAHAPLAVVVHPKGLQAQGSLKSFDAPLGGSDTLRSSIKWLVHLGRYA